MACHLQLSIHYKHQKICKIMALSQEQAEAIAQVVRNGQNELANKSDIASVRSDIASVRSDVENV